MKLFGTICAAALLALSAVTASAATFGGSVYGAFNTYSMEEWNDVIDEANEDPSFDYNNVNSGFTGGLDLRMWATPSWMFSVGWEPLFARIEDDAGTDETEFDLNAHVISGNAAYFFPTAGSAKYGIGAGVDYILNSGELSNATESIDIEGSGIGFHVMGLAEWMVSPGFAIHGGAGYRMAKVTDGEWTDGTDTIDALYENDYSGVVVRAGLAFYLPSGSN